MKAVLHEQYGGPAALQLLDLPIPEPGPREVLVRVRAAALNRSDWENLVGSPLYVRTSNGLLRPRGAILGSDFAGEVVAVGSEVRLYKAGDRVFGDLMYEPAATFAEYVCFREDAVVSHMPAELGFEEAAALPQAGAIALSALEGLQPGQRVLLTGGGGATGIFMIQLAAAAGAEVTASDSCAKLGLMRSLGADAVFDYRTRDLQDSGMSFDLIIDPIAALSPTQAFRLLAEQGRYLVVGGPATALLRAVLTGLVRKPGGRRLGMLLVKPDTDQLGRLAELAVSGALAIPIARRLKLAQLPEALALLGGGLPKGRLVVSFCDSD